MYNGLKTYFNTKDIVIPTTIHYLANNARNILKKKGRIKCEKEFFVKTQSTINYLPTEKGRMSIDALHN